MAKVQFPTVKVNGVFGTIDYPMMSKGHLKKQKNRDELLKYIKSVLPSSHPLAHSILVLLPGAAQPSTTRSDALGRSATGGKQEALSCRMSAPLRTICCSCSSQPAGSTSSAGTWRSIQNVAGGGPLGTKWRGARTWR